MTSIVKNKKITIIALVIWSQKSHCQNLYYSTAKVYSKIILFSFTHPSSKTQKIYSVELLLIVFIKQF